MKRAAITVLGAILGILVSWKSVILAVWLARRFSWPVISTRWHACWDIENCRVSVWGHAAIAAFLLGPAIAWGVMSFVVGRRATLRRLAPWGLLFTVTTLCFYCACYAFIW